MRPRKTVLLYQSDEDAAARLRFLVTVWGYKLTHCQSLTDLRTAVRTELVTWDVVLMVPSRRERTEEFMKVFHEAAAVQKAKGRALRFYDPLGVAAQGGAWETTERLLMSWQDYTPEMLRDRLRFATVLKRGPKPAMHSVGEELRVAV